MSVRQRTRKGRSEASQILKSMSSAVKKFQSRHPTQHQLLTSMFQSAKQSRKSVFSWQTESEQINCELSNMIRNEDLFKFRKEDEIMNTMNVEENHPELIEYQSTCF